MERRFVELSALGFQGLVTGLLALVYWRLWLQQHRPYFATWAAAWAAFALRLAVISAFVVTRREIWLFAHQALTGVTVLLLLWAALQFSRGARWRRRYLWAPVAAVLWAYVAIFVIRDMRVAGLSAAILLAGVTLWTGIVFWRRRAHGDSVGATMLAWTFTLWGIHHLDYPLLRPLGSGVFYGVLADILFIVAATVGTLFLVLGDGRRALETRGRQLEELTRLLLKAQEEERRRLARELHDEAGQILTAVKIELDLDGRTGASEMVARALVQLRDLSNLLRPSVLDQLGLVPALRGLVDDFGQRTGIEARLGTRGTLVGLPSDLEVVLYRVVQEALTNVARHAQASAVEVRLEVDGGRVCLAVEDNGRGLAGAPVPHLGMLGMHERVNELGGSLEFAAAPAGGVHLGVVIPLGLRS
jgi:signal transduction histidine kinase